MGGAVIMAALSAIGAARTFYEVPESSTPSTPSSGYARIYAASTGEVFVIHDDGNSVSLEAGGAGGGDNITVNGVACSDADFDSATPAAPANALNVIFQRDASSPNNVSAHVTEAGIEALCELADLQGDLALGTKTSGNYALGDAEAGAATTGDSATAFFPSGTLEDALVNGANEADEVNPTLGTQTQGNYALGDAEGGAATTGDSATAFFSTGTIAQAQGGTGAGALTCTAAQALTSNGTAYSCGAPSWAPVTLTSTTPQSDAVIATYTAITGLAFTPVANTNYLIECFIVYTSTAATTGINFAFDVPTAATIHMTGYTTTVATGANEGFSQNSDNVGTATSASVITTENNAVLHAQLRNGVNATSTTLGFTPETANSTSVLAGSTCQYRIY